MIDPQQPPGGNSNSVRPFVIKSSSFPERDVVICSGNVDLNHAIGRGVECNSRNVSAFRLVVGSKLKGMRDVSGRCTLKQDT